MRFWDTISSQLKINMIINSIHPTLLIYIELQVVKLDVSKTFNDWFIISILQYTALWKLHINFLLQSFQSVSSDLHQL